MHTHNAKRTKFECTCRVTIIWNHNGHLYSLQKGTFKSYALAFTSPQAVQDFSKFGVVSGKTYKPCDFEFLNEFDNELLPYYLYGLFTGDGSIRLTAKKSIDNLRITGYPTTMKYLYEYLSRRYSNEWFSLYTQRNAASQIGFLKPARNYLVPLWVEQKHIIGIEYKRDMLTKGLHRMC